MSRWGAAVFVSFAASAFAQEPAPTYVLHFGRTGPSPGMMQSPFGVCTDDAGFVYVAELGGDRVQKWTTTGDYVTRWGGAGASPGLLEQPTDVALDALGNVWVSDRANHRLQCFSREGTFLAAFGGPGSAPGEFLSPSGLTVDAGHLFVADTYNFRIQKLVIHGTTLAPVLSFGSFGPEPGQFLELQDVGIDSEGRIYTTDARSKCVQIFAPDGRFLERFDRLGPTGRLSYPFGICLDAHDNIYVSEPYQRNIVKFTKNGDWILTWGTTSSIKTERLHRPLRMWIDAGGLLFVADYDDTQHADRIIVWRPSDAPTPVRRQSWGDLKRAFR